MSDDFKWHVRTKDGGQGPLSTGEVRDRIRKGALRRGTEVKRDGAPDWGPLERNAAFVDALRKAETGPRILMLALTGVGVIVLALGLLSVFIGHGPGNPVPNKTGRTVFLVAGVALAVLGPVAAGGLRKHGRRSLIGVGAVVGAFLGVFVSQYAPLFGGFGSFGRPWSGARIDGAGLHLLVLAVVGAAIGVVAWRLEQRDGRPTEPRPAAKPEGAPSVADRLRELDKLHEQGLITDEELQAKRKAVLESL